MLRFLIKRSLIAVVTLIAISAVTFLVFFAVPSSPALVMCSKNCTPTNMAAVERSLGLDKPLLTQYIDFHKGIVLGREMPSFGECPAPCLGYSFRTREPVLNIIERALPVTVSIVLGAAVIWLALGISLGMFSALRQGTTFDKVSIGVSLVGASMPVYFFAMVLLLIFVFGFKIFSIPRYHSPFEDPGAFVAGMVLPWLALGFVQSAAYARLSRSQMLETLSEDFVRTARAIGLPKRTVYLRHALRAAITPIVTYAGLDLGALLGGVVITETVFGLKGLGGTAVQAVSDLNLPVVMATVLIAATFIVVSNVIVDCLYAFIDPRVKLS